MKIILATSNAGKLKEFKSLLAPHEIIAYSEILEPFEIIEDENSFAKNAKIKAKAVYNALLKSFDGAKNPLLDECKSAWQNGDLAVLIDARRYGVPVRYGRDAHRRIETAVTLLREGGDKLGVAHRL